MNCYKSKSWQIVAKAFEDQLSNHSIAWVPVTNTFYPAASLFDTKAIPKISLYRYIERINLWSGCSVSCFILSYIYIQRVIRNNLQFTLTRQNAYRLILTAVLISQKFLEDRYVNNETYAGIGTLTISEINSLEIALVSLLGYKLYVNSKSYSKHYSYLR